MDVCHHAHHQKNDTDTTSNYRVLSDDQYTWRFNLDLCSFHINKLIRAENSYNLTSKVSMRCCSEAHLNEEESLGLHLMYPSLPVATSGNDEQQTPGEQPAWP